MEVKDFSKSVQNSVKIFLEINVRTGILTDNIIKEPNCQERDKLWHVTRNFTEIIYEYDINNSLTKTQKEEMNYLCYYSVCALHWNDLLVTDERFDFKNGRFRRDTVALAVCLFSRIDRSFPNYQFIKNCFIIPHTRGSLLLWSLSSIDECNNDNLFNSINPNDAKKARERYLKITTKHGWLKLEDEDDDSPLINIWWTLCLLFKSPIVPYKFILNYIWSSLDVPGGLGLLAEDREKNKYYLQKEIKNKNFPLNWSFKHDIAYIAIYFASETDNYFSNEEVNSVNLLILSWFSNDAQDKESKARLIYKESYELYNKDNSKDRFHYALENIRTDLIQRSLDKNNPQEFISKQLSFVLKDLVVLSKADNKIIIEEYELIEDIRTMWGVDIKLFEDIEIPMENSNIPPSIDSDNQIKKIQNDTKYLKNYPGELYCENEHWWRQNRPLRIKNFPNVFIDGEFRYDDLFYRFTENEVQRIVTKIKRSGSLIYLSFVRKILDKKFDLRGIKAPFWFMPFAIYGNDISGVLYFEQNGLMYNYDSPDKLTIFGHSDVFEDMTCEKGYNGLTDDWAYGSLALDEDVLSSLKINWRNTNSGNNGCVNIVETHGVKYASTLPIVKAIWDNAWKNVVEKSKGTSIFLLGPPPMTEFFNSWKELLVWADDIVGEKNPPGSTENKGF